MPFAYYKKLSPLQKKTYQQSLQASIHLSNTAVFETVLSDLEEALSHGNREKTEEKLQQFIRYLCEIFQVAPVKVRVLERRPSQRWGELHGLYQFSPGRMPLITVWMRTAKQTRVVAFRTFLRTAIHEMLHHLDYTYFNLKNSYHTEGFYRRESSLLKQLLG